MGSNIGKECNDYNYDDSTSASSDDINQHEIKTDDDHESFDETIGHGDFTWTVKDELFKKMLTCNFGDVYMSDPFIISGLKWQIVFYPNGRNRRENCSMLYVVLVHRPSSWENVIIRRTIKCTETGSANTSIAIYNEEQNCNGWPNRCLLLEELQHLKVNKFSITVSLQLISIESNKNILYHNITTIPPKQSINWKIDDQMLTKFELSHYGKPFESDIIEDKSHLFNIYCYPQGIDKCETGFMTLGLQLIHVPAPNISKIDVEYQLLCKETGDRYSRKAGFSIHTQINFIKTSLRLDQLLRNLSSIGWFKYKSRSISLTLSAVINVLSIYDNNNQPITKQNLITLQKPLAEREVSFEIANPLKNKQGTDRFYHHQKITKLFQAEKQMRGWMENCVKLPQYIDLMIENGLDNLYSMKDVTQKHLENMDINIIGHRIKIMQEIKKLN